ncbi:MAG: OB-fold domain-containing protein [Pseudomonadota bacterium]
MALTGEYLGMTLTIEDVDQENIDFFEYCAKGEFRLQRGQQSGLLRYPPTTACPWTTDRESEWVPVEGKGAVHSYTEVHHGIQPAFRERTPYMVLVVDLDEQKGKPSEHESLRVAGNLVTPDGELAPPEVVRSVGIGTRVRMVFSQVGEGFAVPNWTIDEDANQPAEPWRYPQE